MANDISNRLSKDERNRDAELGIPPAGYRRRRGGGGRRRLAIIAAAIVAIVLVVAVGWSFGRHSVRGVPVIEAQSGAVRVKPANPGGMQVAGTDDAILSGQAENGKAALAPPPEAPAPQDLRSEKQPANAPATPPPAAGRSATAAPAIPPLAPAGHQAGQAPQAAASPAAAAVQATKPPAAAATPERSTAAAQHGAEVQLAAVGSEHAAKLEWGRLAKRMPGLFDGRRPAFVRAERDGHVFWRLRTGGFADTAQATAFCERVRAKGGGCSLASF